eukprot:TRINITY_DN17151_c0_g1_i1.p1 TRINITY_DN17151_c0_g1~~TRINITY_DN17151_c0_g1_i1.p1  ORF type:complete len:414 (+),score=124.75 TRINITY_DN17151_c0_g1_i1:71-1312(+)
MYKLEDIIRSKIKADYLDEKNAFYLVNLENVVEQFNQWRVLFPNVTPFYACKCNPNPGVLHTLARLGTSFDCASAAEMERILGLGVSADRIIFANPTKFDAHILFAKEHGVKRMTFDNADELHKVAELYPDAQLVLRIITDDSHSLCKFSVKFGAPMDVVPSLLRLGAQLGLNIVGVSFHVGSGCGDPTAFARSAQDALKVFQMGKEYGFNMHVLDIGGGFLGTDFEHPHVSEIAKVLNPELEKFPQGTELMAEPGRYFVTKSHTLVVNIFSKRPVLDDNDNIVRFLYYINDGVYHSFNCIFFDHQHPMPVVLDPNQERTKTYESYIFGPTCDSLDCITKEAVLPELDCGQWLFFENMGAYTSAAQTAFNGFPGTQTTHYIWGLQFVDSFMDVFDGDTITGPRPKAAPSPTNI